MFTNDLFFCNIIKFEFMKKLISLISLFSFIFVFLFTLIPTSFAQTTFSKGASPLNVEINNAFISDQNSKEVVITDISYSNNTNNFVDNLSYRLEFYQGDALAKKGLMFASLDFIDSSEGSLEKLSPNETKTHRIAYQLPTTVPSGKYFLRIIIRNEDYSYYGINYTKNPIKIEGGSDDYVPFIKASLELSGDSNLYALMEGPVIQESSIPSIIIPKEYNSELEKYLESNEVFVSYNITHLSDEDTIVHSEEQIPLGLLETSDGIAWRIKFNPWASMKSGSHLVVLNFENFDGEKIAPDLTVRLLFEGLLGRVYETNSGINSYKKNDPIDLNVNVVVAGYVSDDQVFLEAVLHSTKDYEQRLEKEINLDREAVSTNLVVDFMGETADRSMRIDEINVYLKDGEGNLLDSQTIEIDPSNKFAYEREFGPFQIVMILLLLLIVTFVIAKAFGFGRGKKIFSIAFFAVTLMSLSLFQVIPKFVQAYPGLILESLDYYPQIQAYFQGDVKNNISELISGEKDYYVLEQDLTDDLPIVWSDPEYEPSGETDDCDFSSNCVTTESYVKLECKECNNSSPEITVNFFNDWRDNSTVYREPIISHNDQGEVVSSVDASSENTYDPVNWWIWGPFAFEYCWIDPEVRIQNEEDSLATEITAVRDRIDEIDEASLAWTELEEEKSYLEGKLSLMEADYSVITDYINGLDPDFSTSEWYESRDGTGTIEQQYAVSVSSHYGTGFCQYSSESMNADFEGITTMVHELTCKLPSIIRGTLFIDENESGLYDSGESYVKNTYDLEACPGTKTNVFGHIDGDGGEFTDLSSNLCLGTSRPYFEQEVPAGTYEASINDDGWQSGWHVTGVSDPFGTENFTEFNALANSVKEIFIGLKAGYPVSFTCSLGSGPAVIWGCTDPVADNYDLNAEENDGSCVYGPFGCTDTEATNWDPAAAEDESNACWQNNDCCEYTGPSVLGCTDPLALNHNAEATVNDGSCEYGNDGGGGGGGGGCFVAGSKIDMEDGSRKSIEDIKVGDMVLTYNLETNKLEAQEVLETSSPIHNDIVHLTFEHADNRNTFDHPYYVKGKGWSSYKPALTLERYFIDVKQLEIGDLVLFLNEKGSLIESELLKIEEEIGYRQTYNLDNVANNNNYFVNGILVHNKRTPRPYSDPISAEITITNINHTLPTECRPAENLGACTVNYPKDFTINSITYKVYDPENKGSVWTGRVHIGGRGVYGSTSGGKHGQTREVYVGANLQVGKEGCFDVSYVALGSGSRVITAHHAPICDPGVCPCPCNDLTACNYGGALPCVYPVENSNSNAYSCS
jgi:hypothetical protein